MSQRSWYVTDDVSLGRFAVEEAKLHFAEDEAGAATAWAEGQYEQDSTGILEQLGDGDGFDVRVWAEGEQPQTGLVVTLRVDWEPTFWARPRALPRGGQ